MRHQGALGLPQVLATSDGTKDLYGLDRIGVVQGGAWQYSLPDALGSVRQWTDPAGAVLAAQSYGPFGEARDPLGTPPWGFTGEWQDPTCCGTEGMVYLRARWYNPSLGRFTQVDPVTGSLGAPATQHRYLYAVDSPLVYTDPSGRTLPDEGPMPEPPAWLPGVEKWAPPETMKAAERAYRSFVVDPRPFIALYAANPGPPERQLYADLEFFAMYSTLNLAAGAEPLVLQAAEQWCGPDRAELIAQERIRGNYQGLFQSMYNTLRSWGVPLPALVAGLNLPFGDQWLNAQVKYVIEHMDAQAAMGNDFTAPPGVYQGGYTVNGRDHVWLNLKNQLPKGADKAWYIESDIWPTEAYGRLPGRLVIGRDGQVWITAHYDDGFVKIR